MDVDLDWCLTCEKRIEGSYPYCSVDCQNRAGPSTLPEQTYYSDDDEEMSVFSSCEGDVIFHEIDAPSRWSGNDSEGIMAWAADVPAGPPVGGTSTPCSTSSSECSFSSSTHRPLPDLLRVSRRAVPPTLCTTTPLPQPPPLSTPLVTPKRHTSVMSVAQTSQDASMTSLKSALTDSSIATPASSRPMPILSSKPSIIGDMYNHVRSWVSPSPAISVPAEYQQQRHQPPIPWVDSSFGTLEQVAETEQPTTKRTQPRYETPRGRSRLVSELALLYDEQHPSFRTRGRRASRAAA